jgi:RNA polymerase sigma-70 factor (ECF subfamily)
MDGIHDASELARRARTGDRVAFGLLFEQHRPMLLAVCDRMLGRSGGLEEVVQDTAVTALLGVSRLRDPESFGSWLVGIGLNLCRRRLRADARQGASSRGLPVMEEPDEDPANLLEARELEARVAEAVRGLPQGQREAVVAFYLDGLTYEETASALGIGVGAVKTRLHKGRARLRGRLLVEMEEVTPMTSNGGLVAMRLTDVVRLEALEDEPTQWVLLLEQADHGGRLPIWVGEPEATWAALAIEGTELPRPGPYHMIQAMLNAAGIRVREVRIERLVEATFYATVLLDGPTGPVSVDGRPSDALNVAALCDAPILVAAGVLADAASGRGFAADDRVEAALAQRSAPTIAAETKERWERSLERVAGHLRGDAEGESG